MELDLWTDRTVTLPRAVNFAAFCIVVVGMLAVEVVWGRRGITTDTRNTWQMMGFCAIAAFCIAEAILRGINTGEQPPRTRGFPVQRKDDDK